MKDLPIRNAVESDLFKLKLVIDSSALFPSELLDDMIAPYLNGTDESVWLTGDSQEPTFVAFCDQEKMTQGTWNLYLIAVHKQMQGTGIGKRVLQHLEALLKDRGARVLIVETSSLPEFESSRAFYAHNGYTEEARIRDFYEAGDDKIVFWKKL